MVMTAPWRDEAEVREAVEEGLSLREMASRFGCGKTTVSRWIDRHGIEWEPNETPTGRDHPKWREYARFETHEKGYEYWRAWESEGENKLAVMVHRLLAVAEHDFDAVAGQQVHHANGVPWDNRHENIDLMDIDDHAKMHSTDRQRVEGRFA